MTQIEGREVTYIHLAFDRHHVITAEGVDTESFFVGPQALAALDAVQRAALFEALPMLRLDPALFGSTARPCLKRHEAQMLLHQRKLAARKAA